MGITATAVHAVLFVLAIELLALAPMLANLVAFMVALGVSFLGHFHWTFRPEGAAPARRGSGGALARFLVVALIGLALNSAVVYVVIDRLGWPYQVALVLMVSAVPAVVFVLSKLWAFAPAPG